MLLKLKGVDGIAAAEGFKGKVVMVERAALGELPEGYHYVCDLLGLTVKTDEGQVLGVLEDIIKTGATDVYVITGDGGTVMVPAIDEVLVETDIEGGYIVVKPLKGLLDL